MKRFRSAVGLRSVPRSLASSPPSTCSAATWFLLLYFISKATELECNLVWEDDGRQRKGWAAKDLSPWWWRGKTMLLLLVSF